MLEVWKFFLVFCYGIMVSIVWSKLGNVTVGKCDFHFQQGRHNAPGVTG